MEGKIYEAISNVMRDVGIVGKTDTNAFDKYKYRGIDAVMNALNPAMIKNHVFVTPTILDAQREERQGKSQTMMYSILKVKYTFYTDDGSSVECIVIGEAMDRSDKSTNKAMSAAFKYACFQTFCIPTEEMHDSEEESLEIGNKSDEQKNREMVASVDPVYLVAANGKATVAQRKKFDEELIRTGVKQDVVLGAVGAKSIDELTGAQIVSLLNRLAKTKDKDGK